MSQQDLTDSTSRIIPDPRTDDPSSEGEDCERVGSSDGKSNGTHQAVDVGSSPTRPFHPVRGGRDPCLDEDRVVPAAYNTTDPADAPASRLNTSRAAAQVGEKSSVAQRQPDICVRGRASPAAPHLQPHPDWSLSPTIDIPNPAASATKPPTDTRQGGQTA